MLRLSIAVVLTLSISPSASANTSESEESTNESSTPEITIMERLFSVPVTACPDYPNCPDKADETGLMQLESEMEKRVYSDEDDSNDSKPK